MQSTGKIGPQIGASPELLHRKNSNAYPPLSLLLIPPAGLYLLVPSAQPDAPSAEQHAPAAYLSHQDPYTQ